MRIVRVSPAIPPETTTRYLPEFVDPPPDLPHERATMSYVPSGTDIANFPLSFEFVEYSHSSSPSLSPPTAIGIT